MAVCFVLPSAYQGDHRKSIYKTYKELSLFLNAETVAKVLGIAPSSSYELMHETDFPDFEVLVATHIDTEHLHNHLVVNSVSCVDGRKLHQNAADLQQRRKANDEIYIAHGLNVLEPPQKRSRKKQIRPGEYQAGLRGDSWKLDLIHAINEALEYVDDRESFIEFMGNEGYQVTWADNRKHITFTCPNGRKCGDSSLHDKTFLKENLEVLFTSRTTRWPAG